MAKRSTVLAIVVAAAVVVVGGVGTTIAVVGANQHSTTTDVTVRVWDPQVAKAYRTSFAAFEKKNPGITVTTDVVPYANYFTKLQTDLAAGDMDDIFWANSASFAQYAKAGDLLDIGKSLGADAAKSWQPSVVKQYTYGGSLWGVPQLSDLGIGDFYNATALKKAGVTVAELNAAKWDPSGKDDTLLPLLQKLTLDANGNDAASPAFDPNHIVQYGFNAGDDLEAIYMNFLGSNGAALQKGDRFVFDTPKGVEAFQYMVDLINKYHVAPPASNTNTNGSFSLNEFTQGKMAVFQSGTYNLANIEQGADFPWGIANLPTGPAGRISVTNGVIAAGNAHSKHLAATEKVLRWMGSTAGATPIGAKGSAVPGVVAAQKSYFDYWKAKKVDISPLQDVLKNGTVQAPQGANFTPASNAFGPIFQSIFLGQTPVAEGLKQAQAAANSAKQ